MGRLEELLVEASGAVEALSQQQRELEEAVREQQQQQRHLDRQQRDADASHEIHPQDRGIHITDSFDTRARLDGNTTGTVRASCATAFAMSPKMKRCTGYIVYQ